jgi:hypothetical protein
MRLTRRVMEDKNEYKKAENITPTQSLQKEEWNGVFAL